MRGMKKEEAKKIINVKKKKIDIAKDICIEEKNNEKNIQKQKSWFFTFTIGAFYHHGHDFSNNA